ncbi:MAG: FG-GAP-like repeat-containing protein, partial [Actinomycetota bacterium]|nr:FG-GAP-like repeat-containing protein [Actinomycetota bacterium]
MSPTVRSFPVTGVSRQGVASLGPTLAKRAETSYAALSRPAPATGFAVAGATWTGATPAGLTLAIRTETDGLWSAWTPMDYDADHGPDSSSAESADDRAGSDPVVVGDVDHVQLRVASDTGRAPAGLDLSVVDPGESEPRTGTLADADASKTTTRQSPSAIAPVASASATPAPTINSRAAWGADERLRDCCVEYGEVHAGFVHHTVNANDYTRAEVPAILRGIYAYHTQSRGWRDVGYNFLVDKFGRIWEGRYGGISLPVVGAHTLNYNENSFAASAIGNFETAQPSTAVLDAYARLYAWKLSLHGVRPASRQQVAGTVFDAISGHRDAAATACPGRYLYAKIPDIISAATSYQHPFSGRSPERSFLRDSRPDVLLVSRTNGAVLAARGTGAPGFDPSRPATAGFTPMDQVSAVRDVTGDKLDDLMMRTTATGRTAVYPGRGDGTFAPPLQSSTRWASTDLFAGPGDVTGDSLADVVARSTTSKDLLVYPGRGDGTFRAARIATPALSGINQLSAAGDFDRDGRRDLLARSNGGALVVLLGDGTGHFPSQLQLAARWTAYDQTMGGVDLTGDGRPDVA